MTARYDNLLQLVPLCHQGHLTCAQPTLFTMPPTSPMTPRTRQRRIANGRQRFEELKRQRIARMRDAATEEADMLALLAATPGGVEGVAALSDQSSDTEDDEPSEWAPELESPRVGSRSLGASPVKASPSASMLAHERALRFKAEEARRHAEEERAHAEGLLALAREERAENEQRLTEALCSAQVAHATQQSELDHYRARTETLQEEQAALLNKLQVKRKRIAALDKSLETLRRDLERAACKERELTDVIEAQQMAAEEAAAQAEAAKAASSSLGSPLSPELDVPVLAEVASAPSPALTASAPSAVAISSVAPASTGPPRSPSGAAAATP